MDMMYDLINLIDNLLDINNNDVNKVENIIINHEYYNKLDMDEQILVIDTIKEKIINKKNKMSENSYSKNKISENLYSKNNSYRFADSSKTYYKKKIIEPTIFMTDSQGNTITEGEAMSSKTKAIMLSEITPELYEKRSKIFEQIRSIILPEQRSPEWFAMRNGKITASDGGAVVGKNKHEPQYNFILKKVLGSTFETGEACYHGKKFEQVVTMMYEYKNDVYTEEFGLLGHPEYYFLGASPDGICSPFKRDKITPTPLVGRMLEIKCPLMRKIKYEGDIKDKICPIYYWCQVQLQLECCDLDECDFVQCNIEEYKSREDWLNDTDDEFDFKSKKYGLERGVIIELLSAKLSEDDFTDGEVKLSTVYNQASFIYPPKIDMSIDELDNWILNEINNLKPTVKLHRIIYWRLIENNCTLILRDNQWFKDNLETLRTIWSYVEFLRLNVDVTNEWKNFIDNLNMKSNDKIIKKLVELIEIKKHGYENYIKLTEIQNQEKKNSSKVKKTKINIDTTNINLETDLKNGSEETSCIPSQDPKIVKKTKVKEKTDDEKKTKKSKLDKDNIKDNTDNIQSVTEIINQIPNIQLSDDSSDENIILPNIKRPGKVKK